MKLHLIDMSFNMREAIEFTLRFTPLALFAFIFLHSTASPAADTIETWDVGASDLEFYSGYAGLGRSSPSARSTHGDMLLGFGLLPRFSAYLDLNLSANGHGNDARTTPQLGLFGTVVDSPHFDVDLLFDLSNENDCLQFAPAVEINVDADPDMSSVGSYFRVGLPFGGAGSQSDEASRLSPEPMDWLVESSVGLYATVAHGHQLLLQLDFEFHPDPPEKQGEYRLGGLALGYNFALTDSFELIHEVYLDAPSNSTAPVDTSLMVGFIATLPSAPTADRPPVQKP